MIKHLLTNRFHACARPINGVNRPINQGGVGGSEDFAYISQEVPSIMVGLCAGEKGSSEPLHSPHIRFEEASMPYGVAVLSSVALAYCQGEVACKGK